MKDRYRKLTCKMSMLTVKHLPAWFPGAQFQRDAKIWSKYLAAMYDEPFRVFKASLVSMLRCNRIMYSRCLIIRLLSQAKGQGGDSVAASLLDTIDKVTPDPEYGERIIKSALASAYGGGIDTVKLNFSSERNN